MYTNNIIIIFRNIILICGCVVFFLYGCDKQPESQSDQKVISKKIDMKQRSDTKADNEEEKQPSSLNEEAIGDAGEKESDEQDKGIESTVVATSEVQEAGPDEKENTQEAKIEPKDNEKIQPDSKVDSQESQTMPAVAIGINEVPIAYNYNPVGKIDPFASIFKEQTEPVAAEIKTTEENKRIPLTPLEKISLDQLKLAAVMLAPSGDKALVEEASGKGYVITQGTYIGRNSGRVVDILLDRIIIEEIVKDLLGKSVVKRTEMMLQKIPGE